MIQPFTAEPIQWVSESGVPVRDLPERFTPQLLRDLHALMLRAREFDRKLITLLRQGRTTFYAQSSGMEATQVGLARSIRVGHDWVWPYYRDHTLGLAMGVPMFELISQCLGSNSDPSRGRQMPHHFAAKRQNFVSISSSIASQVPPAAGNAMAQKYLGVDEITVCTFGDGATSEGDWHAGMNMAGAHQAPALFVCENNQWAISTHLRAQTASENIHIKAKAYGMPGFYVDGNDIVAVMEVCAHAAEWVRAGNGPALVECLTYRVGSHSNADADAEKHYRTREEVEEWLGRDPIVRIEKLLEHLGHPISAEERAQMIAQTHREVDEQVIQAEATGQPDWRIIFEDVYADMPGHLRDQEAQLRAEQEAGQEVRA
ncbi:thiamine pyrophosphate-dependent dehydrogenase E1 component subunit alpha [Deinococcus deserti]|uniref:2-oxoisovalerate dehydrogenase subunit alpha n=1 Tax=Deinococcus deserti (strain DSM 17065 / CIP 109153 / LMG 22923 / VCD115) TaxID=546414 RepID=C1D0B1_DEIDV|nr:thiamine pyrophosphate-dependent dehydrogenase E1 component subunit alpha [Deinococcus deserti]ACO47380.1 putative pyruvate dehydrogenase subunit alpha (acetyl-transferring) [Deinococcus deserti VCD115]